MRFSTPSLFWGRDGALKRANKCECTKKYFYLVQENSYWISMRFSVQLFIFRYSIKVLQHPKVRKGYYAYAKVDANTSLNIYI